MLSELYIKNYLLLKEIRLKFNQGLTVISGETGAGKSILVGSISLIFGDNNAGTEAYDKAQPIYLEATFAPSIDTALREALVQSGITEEEELILAREISPAGKSSYYLNGRKVGASLMKELKPLLIDFHHQRDQQKLLSPAYQLELLDAFAGAEPKRTSFAELYSIIKSNLKRLEQLKAESQRQKQLQELYQFQFEELEAAKLSPGEDTALQSEYELLSHGSQISELSISITQSLYEGENSIYDQISAYLSQLQRFSKLNPLLDNAAESLSQSLESIQEACTQLSDASDSLISNPERLEKIQARLDAINSLVYKHKVRSIAELMALFAERAAQLTAFASLEDGIAGLEKQLDTDFGTLKAMADELSLIRTSAATKLSELLQADIRRLSIPNGIFEIRIDKKGLSSFVLSQYIAAVTETGQDTAEFFFTANSGFALKPLVAVVSGGELSRILLAIKKVLSLRIAPKLMILDEIDSGIGGKTAEQVAEFIYELAARQEVMCITHLAQIAARADTHIAITKNSDQAHSTVSLSELDAECRLQEIARMLSGSVSLKALEHAKELISEIKKRGYSG